MLLDPATPANFCAGDPCATPTPFYYAPAGTEPVASDINAKLSKPNGGLPLPLRATIGRGVPNPALGPGYHSVLRIRTRKNSALFQLKLFNAGTEITAIPLPNAIIDVTARIGNSYRRTQREVPITASTFPGLSDVIYSDTSICKDFNLITSPGYEQIVQDTCAIGDP